MKVLERTKRNASGILIVEDSPTQAERLKFLLDGSGHTVMVTINGKEALAAARKEKPWLIITDIVMPEMDGYTLCREVKSDKDLKNTPVVLLTSLSGPEEVIRALKCGADNFMRKPYDDKRVLSLVEYIFANREIRDSEKMKLGLEIDLGGERYLITSGRQQILDLLLSTFMDAVEINRELRDKQQELALLAGQLEIKVEERTAALTAEINERRRAEEALKLSEARYRNLVKNATYGISLVGADGKYVEVNRAMVEMLGYESEAEVLLLDIATEVYRNPEDRQRFLEETRRTGPFHGIDVEMKRQDGKIITVRLSGREVRSEQDQLQGYEVITEDITEREHFERQLHQLQKFEAIGRLAGGVAHDFNNHLGIILGYGELLLDRLAPTDSLRKNAQMIKDAALKAASLTRQLLAFSRQQVVEARVLDLNRNISELGKMLQPLLGEDIELIIRQEPALGQVKADPSQIDQVIMNLVVNARDAMPRGGKLSIETSNVELDEAYAELRAGVKPGPYVMLAVSDTGIGMDKDTQAHIFEPFFTTKEKDKGTGLGLATLYGIVKQSNGSIWVYSEPGHGATFKIYLPRLDPGVQESAADKILSSTPKGSETVLTVEDKEPLRDLACEFLKGGGYTVLEAGNGGEAIEISKRYQGPIHLLMTDAIMPGMSGRELAERLQALRPEMNVLYVSGYTDDAILRNGLLIPGTAFLQKPFTRDALMHKVRAVLERKRGKE